jgi:hypothetical protein
MIRREHQAPVTPPGEFAPPAPIGQNTSTSAAGERRRRERRLLPTLHLHWLKQNMTNRRLALSIALLFATAHAARADMRITEWMYSGANGEFVEFTNMGAAPVNMADSWFYTDSDQGMMDADLAAFGVVQPGESVIIAEAPAAAFRTAWALDAAVKIIGENINSNLSRVDEINLYHSGMLIDRLTFGDNRVAADPPVGAPATAGSIRTQNRSGNPLSLAALGANNVFQWTLASAQGTDAFGSVTSATGGDRANPGFFYLAIPEPSAQLLALSGLAGVAIRRRR